MKNLGYYNGKVGEFEEMSIPMGDRSHFFGDGVYDATYSRHYHIHALDEHIDRLFNSARLLRIDVGMTKDEMKAILNENVRKMDTGENFVYFQITRGTGTRNHVFPSADVKSNFWINISPKGLYDISKKVRLMTKEDTRFYHCNIKTINLLPSVIASQEAKENDCYETVFHRGTRVTECAHSNVHIIKNGTFITAPADELILPGITRKHLIENCAKLGIPVKEIPYTLDELMDADEIIVSSAGTLCAAAYEVDGKAVGGKAPELLEKLQKNMMDDFMRETE